MLASPILCQHCKGELTELLQYFFFLVLSLTPRGFSLGTVFFSSPQKPTLSHSNSIWNARTRLNESLRTPTCFVGKTITVCISFITTKCLWKKANGVSKGKPLTISVRRFQFYLDLLLIPLCGWFQK